MDGMFCLLGHVIFLIKLISYISLLYVLGFLYVLSTVLFFWMTNDTRKFFLIKKRQILDPPPPLSSSVTMVTSINRGGNLPSRDKDSNINLIVDITPKVLTGS